MRRSARYVRRDAAEKTFPFRAIVEVPKEGFGGRINLIREWLQAQALEWGTAYEQHPASRKRGEPEADTFYFRDRATRDRFLAEGVPASLETSREDRPDLEGGAGTA